MYKILITTSNDKSILDMIAKECVLNKKLSPCVHIINNASSFYLWNDDFISEKEYLLFIKCNDENIERINDIISANHNYDVPELVSVQFDIVSEKYKEWFNKKWV